MNAIAVFMAALPKPTIEMKRPQQDQASQLLAL